MPLKTKFTTLVDITLPLDDEVPLYPGDSSPRIRRISSMSGGARLTASEITIGCHVGTHVDAPAHFLAGGETIDQLNLKHFYGPAQVIHLPDRDCISKSDVQSFKIDEETHILFKTKNSFQLSDSSFYSGYCFVTPEAIEYLLQFRPLSIGIDYYSLDPPSESEFPAHTALAKNGLPAFVCLDMRLAQRGTYFYLASPLKIPNLEGSPVRAFLIPIDD